MVKPSNQDIEKYYFDKFRKDYPLPSGTVIYGDKPDVIIDGERKIGIEITNFYHESGSIPECEQNQSRLRDNTVSDAQRLYQKQNYGKKFEISFGFNKAYPIRNQQTLINKIVELAKQIQDLETGRIPKDYYNHIPELRWVYLNNREYLEPKWRIYQVHSVPILQRDQLVDIVKNKEQRCKNYVKCDSYWLLVVVDFMDPAQDQVIKNDDFKNNKVENKAFERVLVYNPAYRKVFEAK